MNISFYFWQIKIMKKIKAFSLMFSIEYYDKREIFKITFHHSNKSKSKAKNIFLFLYPNELKEK